MQLKPVAQNILEWLGIRLGLVPGFLGISHLGFIASRCLLEAVDRGIFEAIGHLSITPAEIAVRCSLHPAATTNLLNVLASMALVKEKSGNIFLTPPAKKWLLQDSPKSLYWLMIFDNRVCYKWADHTDTFLKTGRGLQYHDTFTPEEWHYYQKAMEAVARLASTEVARSISIPANARNMLDIGGSHGLYSVALTNKYFSLSSIVFDLPGAVEQAASILQGYNKYGRVKHYAGNILKDDIGKNKYDVVLMASVAHHFTEGENKLVAQKVYEAIKPGGMFVIMEVLKPYKIVNNGDMFGALGNFFFGLSSTSGAWSLEQIKSWQTQAGFTFYRKKTMLTIPGYIIISFRK